MRSASVIWLTGLSFLVAGGCNPSPQPEEPLPPGENTTVTPPETQPQPQPEPEPTPEPEQVLEPEPLPPPEEIPTKTITYYLAPEESGYVWNHGCSSPPPPAEDPFGPPDPNVLVVSRDFWSCVSHFSFVKFVLGPQLSTVTRQVSLELFCLDYSSGYLDPPGPWISILDEKWWWPAPDPATWRVFNDDELPETRGWSNPLIFPKAGEWYSLDITDLYNIWSQGEHPNYGLMLHPYPWLDSWRTFASGRYSKDPTLRPRVVVEYAPAIPKKLRFPLDGVLDANGNIPDESISGYRFGEHWENGYCLDGQTKLLHTGIDLRASAGTPVYAVNGGIVRFARTDDKEGGYVVIEHAIGDIVFTSTYTHVIPVVKENQKAEKGQLICRVSEGNPHLHLQIRLAPYHKLWSRRGRLPERECVIETNVGLEPAFHESFVDPKDDIAWE